MDLGSLNMENIENILSSMSDEDMEMLSGMAQSLFSSMGQKEENKEKEKKAPSGESADPFSSFNPNMETIGKIMTVMQKLRSRPADPRCNLLLSLKPMLNEQKQGKIDEAVKIMSLLSFIPLLDELRGDGNG
ncbi:MAG: hypothetical protein IKK60_03155 [Clostridia bacterium]|nr:hypothetical protein [Clostridia bacterium]